ncbi:unnamed protein product [Protopolystoma xenopodis]|uniref:Uncharacterized protein n=1 Tax=Protopolystoma xenopodis TaxID=117903 RepID=A0A3S5BDG1_9PLAT|nr:unnamed protein product [Protopolystoma xenopodis]
MSLGSPEHLDHRIRGKVRCGRSSLTLQSWYPQSRRELRLQNPPFLEARVASSDGTGKAHSAILIKSSLCLSDAKKPDDRK